MSLLEGDSRRRGVRAGGAAGEQHLQQAAGCGCCPANCGWCLRKARG